jgi:hypothetical protein
MSSGIDTHKVTTIERFRVVRRVLRIAQFATYPFVFISIVALAGTPMLAAFIIDITIVNETDQRIVVTPVGTIGEKGRRSPLPVFRREFPPIQSTQRGGFGIEPGDSTTIFYDWDDINFSEIVVRNEQEDVRQLVVDPNPTTRQYHSPEKKEFVIDDFKALAPVPVPVLDAADIAQTPTIRPWILVGVIVVPWLVLAVLACINSLLRETRVVRIE